jgi:hypothetical protein
MIGPRLILGTLGSERSVESSLELLVERLDTGQLRVALRPHAGLNAGRGLRLLRRVTG